jgi:hypothetical protein
MEPPSWFTKKTGYGLEVLYAGIFLVALAITLAHPAIKLY